MRHPGVVLASAILLATSSITGATEPGCGRSGAAVSQARTARLRASDLLGASDPFAAAQSGVDWLLGALCAWIQDPSHVDRDCATGGTVTCLGCHVQGEAIFALSRSVKRCYAPPVTACLLPGDLNPIEFS